MRVINKDSSGVLAPETCWSLPQQRWRIHIRATGAGTRSRLQPGIKALGTPGTPFTTSLPLSAWLLNSPPCLVLFFLSQGQNSGYRHLLLGKPPSKTDLSLVLKIPVSYGVSPQCPSFTSPRGEQSVGAAIWILASSREPYGDILEICGTVLVVSD